MERLARQLPADGFGWYVAITRGGLVPACLLAQITGQRFIDTICIESRMEDGSAGYVSVLDGKDFSHLHGGRVLLVDDLCDSGRTMQAAVSVLKQFLPSEIKTAALFVKKGSVFRPDYFVEERPADKWINFPWEEKQAI